MCIGMHLGLAEMVLVPSIYRRYSTRIKPGFEGITPGITSRFEIFYDETFEKMEVSLSQVVCPMQSLTGPRSTLAGSSSISCSANPSSSLRVSVLTKCRNALVDAFLQHYKFMAGRRDCCMISAGSTKTCSDVKDDASA